MNAVGVINLHARARGSWPQCLRIKGPGAALSFVWITGSRLAAFYDGDRLLVWNSTLPYGIGVTVGVLDKGGSLKSTPEQQCVMQGIEGEVTASASAPDGSLLAVGTDDGIMSIVRLADLQVASRIRVEDSAITCVKFASTGLDVVWVHSSGRSVLWRHSNDRPTGVFSVPAVVSQAFMMDARVQLNGEVMLVSSSGDLWRLSSDALYLADPLAEVKAVSVQGRRAMVIADVPHDLDAHNSVADQVSAADADVEAPLLWDAFAADIEAARMAVNASAAAAADDEIVRDVIGSVVMEVARAHAKRDLDDAAAAEALSAAVAAESLAAVASAAAAAATDAAVEASEASAALAVAGEIFWPDKEWIGDVIKGGLGTKGKSLQAAARRWQQIVKEGSEGDRAALGKEWRKVDASGNGTISQSEVLTWLATSHPYMNDSLVVQYAFNAVLVLQSQKKTRGRETQALSSSSSRSKASSQSLTFEFFPQLLSNLVAASRAVLVFKLWDAGAAGGADKRLQRKEWEAGVKGLKRAPLTREEMAAEWKAVDADGKGVALFGEFCVWFRCCTAPSLLCSAAAVLHLTAMLM
jgi:hypothetical protein